ncbi:hypothetical protein CAOG_05173 [Capsaspora owczarzaki ATCC 30864]|uniref:Zn(2)-C6 fungal-type domain-containing protein n=1 Tax=Capsaspora owczarzaki (strain ATCC 30864) TaxID=595528 RepID=A0A0D2UHG0_CAPO3|nr:hypothetical protein CAOG_05173 [Capsaspora owczarzaki ATCC 30864]KJE94541.1 hypothetical protein CAOG_005173 [Capsaspora owczarzaki ATCC 30864]|eukprot:XP_004346858.1 hypothetical protein CAOG_05173 [Capsaspora owczarzaki ATCC 30864]
MTDFLGLSPALFSMAQLSSAMSDTSSRPSSATESCPVSPTTESDDKFPRFHVDFGDAYPLPDDFSPEPSHRMALTTALQAQAAEAGVAGDDASSRPNPTKSPLLSNRSHASVAAAVVPVLAKHDSRIHKSRNNTTIDTHHVDWSVHTAFSPPTSSSSSSSESPTSSEQGPTQSAESLTASFPAQKASLASPSCLPCRMAHRSCNRGLPCNRCLKAGTQSSCCYPQPSKKGRKKKNAAHDVESQLQVQFAPAANNASQSKSLEQVQAALPAVASTESSSWDPILSQMFSALDSAGQVLEYHCDTGPVDSEPDVHRFLQLLAMPQHVPVKAYFEVLRELGDLRARNIELQSKLQSASLTSTGSPRNPVGISIPIPALLDSAFDGTRMHIPTPDSRVAEEIRRTVRFSSVSYAKTVMGTIKECSPLFVDLFGATSDTEIVGKTWPQLTHPTFQSSCKEIIMSIISMRITTSVTMQVVFVRKDGSAFQASCTLTAIWRSASFDGCISLLHNDTVMERPEWNLDVPIFDKPMDFFNDCPAHALFFHEMLHLPESVH